MIEYENLKELNLPFMEEYKESFSKTLDSGWFILGENVKNFEKSFAQYCGTKYCVGLNSGLDALILAILSLDLPKQSEIIVPSNTYIATILAIIQTGFTPVLVEPEKRTYNISPDQIEKKISKKTSAIIAVHLYGKLAAMDEISQIAKKNKLKLIEDAAQAHGGMLKGIRAGNWSDVAAFSFYPTKNLGAIGDGGAITTNSKKIAKRIMALRNYGSTKKYHNKYIGFNSRLDEVQAGFLLVKLNHLDEINIHKRKLASIYDKFLSNYYIKPLIEKDYYDVFHIYNILHPERDSLRAYLLNKGIKTEIHYPVVPNRQEAMKSFLKGHYPVAEEIHNTTLSLPMSFCHSIDDIYYVVEKLNEFVL
jgi:dTDP-4-amino-4,6-dideoxygalactose transaminase